MKSSGVQFKGRVIDIDEVVDAVNTTCMTNEQKPADSLINPNLEGLDLETVWQDYWGKYGDCLVWEGWVAKYPDQIDFDKLHAIPATEEVEVTTENADVENNDGQIVGELVEENNQVTELNKIFKETDSSVIKFSKENNKDPSTLVDESVACDKETKLKSFAKEESDNKVNVCTETETDYSKTDFGDSVLDNQTNNCENQSVIEKVTTDDYANITSPPKYSSLSFKQISGENILNTLKNKVEGFEVDSEQANIEEIDNQSGADNLANERTEIIQMMHCYSNISESHTEPNVNEDEQGPSVVESGNYDKMWEDLWNEHYTESYWYYYNHFAEKFNKLSLKHEPSCEQNEVVFETEFIVIPSEQGTCSIEAVQSNEISGEESDNNLEMVGSCDVETIQSKNENLLSSQSAKDNVKPVHNTSPESSVSGPIESESIDDIANQCTQSSTVAKGSSENNEICEESEAVSASLSTQMSLYYQATETEQEYNKSENEKYQIEDIAEKNQLAVSSEETSNGKGDVNKDNEKDLRDETPADDMCKLTSEPNGGGELGHEPEDGSRKKKKKRDRQREEQAQGSSTGGSGKNLCRGRPKPNMGVVPNKCQNT